MPQRFLRPGVTTSQNFNAVDYQAQSFYIRIITLVDDFGRYEADHRLLRSHAFPLGGLNGADIPLKTIAALCEQLSASNLVQFYTAEDGKEYLQVHRWQERARADKSKYPPFDSKCCQRDSKCEPPSSSSSPSSSPSPAGGRQRSLRFTAVKHGLYPREYDALVADAEEEIKKIKSNSANYERKLKPEAAELVESIKARGESHRIDEVLKREDVWERQAMKPQAVADLRAWKDRITEINAARKGLQCT